MDACMLESSFSMSILRSTHAIIKRGISSLQKERKNVSLQLLTFVLVVQSLTALASFLHSAQHQHCQIGKTQSNINQWLFCSKVWHHYFIHTHFHDRFVDQVYLLLVFLLLFYPSPVPIQVQNSNTLPDLLYKTLLCICNATFHLNLSSSILLWASESLPICFQMSSPANQIENEQS